MENEFRSIEELPDDERSMIDICDDNSTFTGALWEGCQIQAPGAPDGFSPTKWRYIGSPGLKSPFKDDTFAVVMRSPDGLQEETIVLTKPDYFS